MVPDDNLIPPLDRKPAQEAEGSLSLPVAVIVEQDAALVRALTSALALRGFQVRAVASVDESESVIAQINPSVVLLDLVEPGNLSEMPDDHLPQRRGAIPVLVLSSKADSARKKQVIHAGAAAYVVKPMSLNALYGFIDALLARNVDVAFASSDDPLYGVFKALVSQHRSYVERLARMQRVGHGDDVQEVADDALLALNKVLPGFVTYDEVKEVFRVDLGDDEIMAWLAVTVRNLCATRRRSALRDEKKLAKLAQVALLDTSKGGGRISNVERSELRDYLECGLRQLSERDRAIVEERYFDDLDFKEIAARHGLSVSRVKGVLAAALRAIGAALAESNAGS